MMHTWNAAPDKRPVFSQISSSLKGERDLDADQHYFAFGEDSVLPEGNHPATGMAWTGMEMSSPIAHTTKSHTVLGKYSHDKQLLYISPLNKIKPPSHKYQFGKGKNIQTQPSNE